MNSTEKNIAKINATEWNETRGRGGPGEKEREKRQRYREGRLLSESERGDVEAEIEVQSGEKGRR